MSYSANPYCNVVVSSEYRSARITNTDSCIDEQKPEPKVVH